MPGRTQNHGAHDFWRIVSKPEGIAIGRRRGCNHFCPANPAASLFFPELLCFFPLTPTQPVENTDRVSDGSLCSSKGGAAHNRDRHSTRGEGGPDTRVNGRSGALGGGTLPCGEAATFSQSLSQRE